MRVVSIRHFQDRDVGVAFVKRIHDLKVVQRDPVYAFFVFVQGVHGVRVQFKHLLDKCSDLCDLLVKVKFVVGYYFGELF